MAEQIVKYKLIKFGSGYTTPSEIYNGGKVWSSSKNISDIILVGNADIDLRKSLPEGIIETITEEQLQEHLDENNAIALDNKKKELYTNDTESLLFEALRKKELGNPKLWNKYLNRCSKIKSLTSIPENGVVDYGDDELDSGLISRFTKLSIRRAMRELEVEDKLDLLLENESFKKDWDDSTEIDLNDEMVQAALLQVEVDVDSIRNKIIE